MFLRGCSLSKLVRNHFVESGFNINDKEINVEVVEKFLELTVSSHVSIAHKISTETLFVLKAGRHKVKYAAKLFFHTISCANSRCGMQGQLHSTNWFECAEFFRLVY